VTLVDDPYGAAKDPDAIIIVTEWAEFRALGGIDTDIRSFSNRPAGVESAIVGVDDGAARTIGSAGGDPPARGRTVYFMPVARIDKSGHKRMVALSARLIAGLPRLLTYCIHTQQRGPTHHADPSPRTWTPRIVGSGTLRPHLEQQIADLPSEELAAGLRAVRALEPAGVAYVVSALSALELVRGVLFGVEAGFGASLERRG
jgi:hypothetical protein